MLSAILFMASCKKDLSCERCKESNKPPITNAGADQTITLPKDSLLLDGSASSDPDGSITKWLWTKVAGPSSFTLVRADTVSTTVTGLEAGIYQFEFTVTDDGGLSAKDTVQVLVNDPAINQPPVACAGADQTITLPTNTVTLDGTCSADPDNNIMAYAWTKIAGPSASTITNANAVQTQVTGLLKGVYEFELTVTDAGGLFSKDIVQVIVTDSVSTLLLCVNRPVIHARLVPVGSLSIPRIQMASATAGNKIFFAGGIEVPYDIYSRVDVYDIATNQWSTAELSDNLTDKLSIATLGSKLFFAGGGDYTADWIGGASDKVDIYNATTNAWSRARLSEDRGGIATATLGNKVFFAGGVKYYVTDAIHRTATDKIDIYDNAANNWTTARLSQKRGDMSAASAGNKIYFTGGFYYTNSMSGDMEYSKTIDIYNGIIDTWSTSSVRLTTPPVTSIAYGDKIYIAGVGEVEIRDINTDVSTFACLIPRTGFKAVVKNDTIIFFTGNAYPNVAISGLYFDIYNTTTNTWSTGILDKKMFYATIISVNNTIYVAGASHDNGTPSQQVYKLEF